MANTTQADTAEDCYASRGGGAEHFVAREDPVVYSSRAARSPADAERVQCYERDGFVVLDTLFSPQEVECFQREALRLQRELRQQRRDELIVEPESREVRSIFDVPRFSPIFKRLLHDARLVGWARYLLDDEVYVHQSRLNYKPAFEGKEFYWHSDFETWHVEDGMPRMRAVSLSIALTDNYACNGSVMLMPGSHQHYVACAGATPENHYRLSLRRQQYGVPSQRALAQLAEGGAIVTATGRAGSVLMFDCNTMHGSAGNITPYARSNLFFVYNAVSNRLQAPYSGQPPRPEFIAHRQTAAAIEPVSRQLDDFLE